MHDREKTYVPVTKRLRYEVLRRDGFTCRYCGAKAPDVPLRVDHVIPVVLGGPDHPSNLVAACQDCNSGKTSTIPNGGYVAAVNCPTVPPSPEVLANEVERLWLDAYTTQYGPGSATLRMLEEVRSSTRDMHACGLTAGQLRRAATTSGLKGEPFIGFGETSDPEWLALTAEAFKIWRSLWFRSTRHTSWPDMQEIMIFECSVEQAINASVDRSLVLQASASAGRVRCCYIEDVSPSIAAQVGDDA